MNTMNLLWAILIGLLVPVTILIWALCAVVLKDVIEYWMAKK